MKSTGIVRKLDKLGRIVVPIELRKTMGISVKDSLEIFTDGNDIILRKYAPGCVFCGEAGHIVMQHNGKLVCESCYKRLTKGPWTQA
jgi:AbrB family transcriptional regulator, transcriptional pleiotropic regulator of transition state genes